MLAALAHDAAAAGDLVVRHACAVGFSVGFGAEGGGFVRGVEAAVVVVEAAGGEGGAVVGGEDLGEEAGDEGFEGGEGGAEDACVDSVDLRTIVSGVLTRGLVEGR